ncbi:MAG: hypoxanthine phosphoribosyltransferase [Ignavibacteria bacterium]|nr:hypoxanthine phosphoribosyltransferase [Ignavibacteria bacterium]
MKTERYISGSEIRKRVKELGKKITSDYRGKVPILIGVLNGSFIFISDLAREIKLQVEIDFLKLSSYGDSKISSGDVKLLKELNCQVEGRDIIVVEDIIDSGLSASFIKKIIEKQNPASLQFVTLLFKKGISNLDFKIKYKGFVIPNKFVVGYGLDYAQKYRNLKHIYILKDA